MGGVLLIIVLGLFLYLRGGRIPELKAERDILDRKWAAFEKNDIRSTDLQEHVNKFKHITEQIEGRLMNKEEKAVNYQYFYQLEQSSGISLSALNQSPGPSSSSLKLSLYEPLEYTVGVMGKYQDVLNFLYELEHGKFFPRIETFSCNSASEEEANIVRVNMKLDILGMK